MTSMLDFITCCSFTFLFVEVEAANHIIEPYLSDEFDSTDLEVH